MRVTIIGAGNMGRGISHRLVAGGHDVTVVDRDPEEAGRLAEELRGAAEGGATVEAAEPGAELGGEVVILAVYYPGNLEIARDLGDRLAGKVVVDISNPLNQTFDGLATAPGTSAAEMHRPAVGLKLVCCGKVAKQLSRTHGFGVADHTWPYRSQTLRIACHAHPLLATLALC